jgi:serine/threonine protein kinase
VAEWSVPGFTGLRALGSGGFGEVVLARHDASGTPVAIKYLRQNLLSDAEFTELFRAEAAVLATVEDPHVVRLYEYVESPAGAAIVMELVDGVSLREILAHQGKTTAEAALVVLRGSLLGLAVAVPVAQAVTVCFAFVLLALSHPAPVVLTAAIIAAAFAESVAVVLAAADDLLTRGRSSNPGAIF